VNFSATLLKLRASERDDKVQRLLEDDAALGASIEFVQRSPELYVGVELDAKDRSEVHSLLEDSMMRELVLRIADHPSLSAAEWVHLASSALPGDLGFGRSLAYRELAAKAVATAASRRLLGSLAEPVGPVLADRVHRGLGAVRTSEIATLIDLVDDVATDLVARSSSESLSDIAKIPKLHKVALHLALYPDVAGPAGKFVYHSNTQDAVAELAKLGPDHPLRKVDGPSFPAPLTVGSLPWSATAAGLTMVAMTIVLMTSLVPSLQVLTALVLAADPHDPEGQADGADRGLPNDGGAEPGSLGAMIQRVEALTTRMRRVLDDDDLWEEYQRVVGDTYLVDAEVKTLRAKVTDLEAQLATAREAESNGDRGTQFVARASLLVAVLGVIFTSAAWRTDAAALELARQQATTQTEQHELVVEHMRSDYALQVDQNETLRLMLDAAFECRDEGHIEFTG